jgi:hypothetical protein
MALGSILGLLIFVLGARGAPAAILRIPQDHPTIQAGIAAASAGDTVLVAPGTYFENLVMKPGVHLHGEPGTILDGSQGFGAVVSARSGIEPTAVLSGFIIRRSSQAGIFLNQAAPTIRNNVITENAGPGIECAQASPHVLNNIITVNQGGGIVCKFPETAPVITYNAFWQNQPADFLGCHSGAENHQQDPGFVNVPQGDYRLRSDSPLIDAGAPDVVYHDPDGSRNDLGAYGGPQPQPPKISVRARLVATDEPLLQDSLSAMGMPGIIDVPIAAAVPSGSIDLGYNVKVDRNVFGARGGDSQQNFNLAVGLLPRLTFGVRGTVVADDDIPPESTPLLELQGDVARDLSANVQLQLLQEGLWWPAIAVGWQDLSGGAANFRSRYVVLSKSAFGRLRGTVGFGTGPDVLQGPFGGVELALNRFITLLGEYDADDISAGIRLFPMPKYLEAYGLPRPTVDLVWQEGDDFSWGVSLRTILGEQKYQAQRAARAHKRYSRLAIPAEGVSFQAVSVQLQERLLERGLENVRVTLVRLEQSYTVVVEYENRRYNRDELDGLGLVLGLTAIYTPPTVTHMSLIVKEVNVPVLQFSTAVDDYLAFINEQLSQQAFGQQIHLTHQVQWPFQMGTVEAATAMRNRSWLKADVVIRPGIETLILTEISTAEVRFSLLLDSFLQLTPGTVVNVRATMPVTETEGFIGRDRNYTDIQLSRALVHQAVRLPLGSWSPFAMGMTQFSIGRFSQEEVGIANETALTLVEGLLFFKGTLAGVGSSYTDLDRWVALANGRVRYPPWDLTLSATAGRFLDQDLGVAADLSRFFGNTEIGVFLRHSDNGSLAGVRLGVPLTPAKELKPMHVRPRLPELYTYEQRTTVFTERNVVRSDIGRVPGTGHEIERVYWNRDRLYPVYIRQHLDTLKQAVRRWVDEAA